MYFLTCVLIYSLRKCVLEDGFKDSCVLKVLLNVQKFIPDELSLFSMKSCTKDNFSGIDETFNMTNSTNLDCQM